MKKIILTAQDFAYGPIGKLLDLVSHMENKFFELVFIGFGTSLQLAKKHKFSKVYKIDTELSKNKNKLKNIVKDADLLISSMDLPSLEIAQELGIKNVWIDCLFWFWDEIPKIAQKADLYIAEISINNKKNLKKFKKKINNLLMVNTILPKLNKKKVEKQVLISLGGAEATHCYQIGKDTYFPFIMTEILLKYVDWSCFDKIYLATNQRILSKLKGLFKKTKIIFCCLEHTKFVNTLSNSEVTLITPGLVTTQTAFYAKTPVLFLPASNNSQYLQLEEYRKEGLAKASVSLSDFIGKLDFSNKREAEANEMVINQISSIRNNTFVKKAIGDKIDKLLKDRNRWAQNAVNVGSNYIYKRGANGAIQALRAIESLMR